MEKLYVEEGNILEIDENINLIVLNVDEFISTLEKMSIVSDENIKAKLKYKIVCNNNEYYGESIYQEHKKIFNSISISDKSPYRIRLVDWNVKGEEKKFLEFKFLRNKIENKFDLKEFWEKSHYEYVEEFGENIEKVLEYLNVNENYDELCVFAARNFQFRLVQFIVENKSIDILPIKCKFTEKNMNQFDYFECEFYGLLCYLLNSKELDEAQRCSCYNLINFLKNKGFKSNCVVEIKNYCVQQKRDYILYFERITNKMTKLDFAKRFFKTYDLSSREENKKIIFTHSYVAMHGIDEELSIIPVDPEIYDKSKENGYLSQSIDSEAMEKIKLILDELNFKNYIIKHNVIIVRDLFIEPGDYCFYFTSMIEW